MPSHNTYHLTWVSLTLDVGFLFNGCSSKAQPLLLALDEGYLLMATHPDLEHGIAPLGPMKLKSESEVAQSCPTLCDPMDCSPPGSSVHGILQARILEWVAISFSRESS